jgi:hypothetical protein
MCGYTYPDIRARIYVPDIRAGYTYRIYVPDIHVPDMHVPGDISPKRGIAGPFAVGPDRGKHRAWLIIL